MAKQNKRLAKKKQKHALINKAKQYGKSEKQLKSQSIKALENIVTYEQEKAKQAEKRKAYEAKKAKQRKAYNDKVEKIKGAGLTGFMSPRTSKKEWDKEWKRAQKKKRIHEKREFLLNIPGINKDKVRALTNTEIDKNNWTQIQNVNKDTAPGLFVEDIVAPKDADTSKVYHVKTGLYIGYYSNDGAVGVGFLLSSFDFYASYTVEELQKILPDVIHQKRRGSSGKAGDTVILIDNTPGTWAMIEAYRALEYHDIILPYQHDFTPKSALALTCAVLEFGREDNRKEAYNDLKGYFKKYGNGLGKFFP